MPNHAAGKSHYLWPQLERITLLKFFLYANKLGISQWKLLKMNSWPKIWCNSSIETHSLNMFLWRAQFFSYEDFKKLKETKKICFCPFWKSSKQFRIIDDRKMMIYWKVTNPLRNEFTIFHTEIFFIAKTCSEILKKKQNSQAFWLHKKQKSSKAMNLTINENRVSVSLDTLNISMMIICCKYEKKSFFALFQTSQCIWWKMKNWTWTLNWWRIETYWKLGRNETKHFQWNRWDIWKSLSTLLSSKLNNLNHLKVL